MNRLTHRVAKLERSQQAQSESVCRIVTYRPQDRSKEGYIPPSSSVPNRYMLVPDFGSDEEWQAAAIAQQRTLLIAARGPRI